MIFGAMRGGRAAYLAALGTIICGALPIFGVLL